MSWKAFIRVQVHPMKYKIFANNWFVNIVPAQGDKIPCAGTGKAWF